MASQSATLTTARYIGCMYAPHDPGGIPGKHHQPRSRWDIDLPFCVIRDPERRSSFETGKREGDGRGWCWTRAREDETRDDNRSPRGTRLVHAAMAVSGVSRPRRGENTNRNDPSTPSVSRIETSATPLPVRLPDSDRWTFLPLSISRMQVILKFRVTNCAEAPI